MRLRLLVLVFACLLISGCTSPAFLRALLGHVPTGFSGPQISISGDTVAVRNGYAEIFIDVEPDTELHFTSSPTGGFPLIIGNRAIWKAGPQTGEHTIMVTAVNDSGIAMVEHTITVIHAPLTTAVNYVYTIDDVVQPRIRLTNASPKTVTSARLKAIVASTVSNKRFEYEGRDIFEIEVTGLNLGPSLNDRTFDYYWAPGFLEKGYSYFVWPYEAEFSDGTRWSLYEE